MSNKIWYKYKRCRFYPLIYKSVKQRVPVPETRFRNEVWGEVSMREYLPPHQLFWYCLNALGEGWCTNTVESVARLEPTCLRLVWMPQEHWLCPTRDSVVSRVSDVVGWVQRCQILMGPVAPWTVGGGITPVWAYGRHRGYLRTWCWGNLFGFESV
jgi:hypothetical protein